MVSGAQAKKQPAAGTKAKHQPRPWYPQGSPQGSDRPITPPREPKPMTALLTISISSELHRVRALLALHCSRAGALLDLHRARAILALHCRRARVLLDLTLLQLCCHLLREKPAIIRPSMTKIWQKPWLRTRQRPKLQTSMAFLGLCEGQQTPALRQPIIGKDNGIELPKTDGVAEVDLAETFGMPTTGHFGKVPPSSRRKSMPTNGKRKLGHRASDLVIMNCSYMLPSD